jgi:RNA:NAD 2'-phosphotransferase (TPT1/KptA family)
MAREISISKALSQMLRHNGAMVQRSDGYVPVSNVLAAGKMHMLGVTLAELKHIVQYNDKHRFQMEEEDSAPFMDSLSLNSRSGYSNSQSQL